MTEQANRQPCSSSFQSDFYFSITSFHLTNIVCVTDWMIPHIYCRILWVNDAVVYTGKGVNIYNNIYSHPNDTVCNSLTVTAVRVVTYRRRLSSPSRSLSCRCCPTGDTLTTPACIASACMGRQWPCEGTTETMCGPAQCA